MVNRTPFRIGKGFQNEAVIADNYISNQHCKVQLSGDRWFLKDLGSTNGTFCKDQRITEITIAGGEKIRLGQTEITFEVVEEREKVRPGDEDHCGAMIGRSRAMRELFALVRRLAPTDATILIQGETGSGKELVARALHSLSPFATGPFVPINCGAISPELIESELFGHEKGAFTGAQATRKGAFESAEKGTLFLDEIGELPLELQPKLLRVLEQRVVQRVGSHTEIPVSCRLLAATHRDLKADAAHGRFREDLFFRLHVVPLRIPPLRDRAEDIPFLVGHFLAEKGNGASLSEGAFRRLQQYRWPGNVRELKNVLTRACLTGSTDALIDEQQIQFLQEGDLETVPSDATTPPIVAPSLERGGSTGLANASLADAERETILTKLRQCGWNKTRAAVELGIAKSTLFKKIKEYNLKP